MCRFDQSKIVAPTIVGLFYFFLLGLNLIVAKSSLNILYVFIHILFVCASNSALVRTISTNNLLRLLSIVLPEAELLINLYKFSSILFADAFNFVVFNRK